MGTGGDLETKAKVVSAFLKALHTKKLTWEALAPLFRPQVGGKARKELAGSTGSTENALSPAVQEWRVRDTRKKLNSPRPSLLSILRLAAFSPLPANLPCPCWDVGIVWIKCPAWEHFVFQDLTVLTLPAYFHSCSYLIRPKMCPLMPEQNLPCFCYIRELLSCAQNTCQHTRGFESNRSKGNRRLGCELWARFQPYCNKTLVSKLIPMNQLNREWAINGQQRWM